MFCLAFFTIMVIKERRATPTPAEINDMTHPKKIIIIKKQLTKSNLTYFFFYR